MDKGISSLLKGYLEKAHDKLRAAETLLKNKEYDDAVSRSYYCSFHAAQAILLTEGLSADSHQGVVNLFGLHFVKTGKFEKNLARYWQISKTTEKTGITKSIRLLIGKQRKKLSKKQGNF